MREARDEASPGCRADIDGLRAIAVTAVIPFHTRLFPFASGYVGVDIFFVYFRLPDRRYHSSQDTR